VSGKEEVPGVSEEEPPPTSPPSQRREEEWYGGSLSFPPHGVREEERCGSREKQISRGGLRPASSRVLSAC
jgi:hypothetical protein